MKKTLAFLATIIAIAVFAQNSVSLNSFVPSGFVIFETIKGDLNKDGVQDCVLIIKGTNKNKIIRDQYKGTLDQNRRGIVVLIKNNGTYELTCKNLNCFSSENEDGGVYYAPELSVEINNNKLYINYEHGRYGSKKYTFRFEGSDFQLIGFDETSQSFAGAKYQIAAFDETSINFLSKKKQIKEVISVNALGKETYNTVWKNISVGRLLKLSEINDFDELDMMRY